MLKKLPIGIQTFSEIKNYLKIYRSQGSGDETKLFTQIFS
jgi:hypothetical protein